MRVAIVCKSDAEGGAAVVSRRLTEALRAEGVEATMLVVDKRTDLPFVVKASYPLRGRLSFLAERLQIALNNGFSRANLFKVDTASFGLPLWRHPVVKEADAVILNWINQGMLSLKGVKKLCGRGKKVIWTMHDMWNITGICHHAMGCRHFEQSCGRCLYLGRKNSPRDLSFRIHEQKERLYDTTGIRFVAVSGWLARESDLSSLLRDRKPEVIPNPIRIAETPQKSARTGNCRILFAAATLDNWIKGLDTFRRAVNIFSQNVPALAARCEIHLMGAVKNPDSLQGFALPVIHLGAVSGEENIAGIFKSADITASASHFESFGATLAEGQAYGAIPVAFDRGGQSDIIDHLSTGYLAPWSDDEEERAARLAEGIEWAVTKSRGDEAEQIRERMRNSIESRFSYQAVARAYIQLIDSIP